MCNTREASAYPWKIRHQKNMPSFTAIAPRLINPTDNRVAPYLTAFGCVINTATLRCGWNGVTHQMHQAESYMSFGATNTLVFHECIGLFPR